MNLHLKRNRYSLYGIFGELYGDDLEPICCTLEHAYSDGSGGYIPKLALGTYQCVRGEHRLRHGSPFITFEIMSVPPFEGLPVTGILFHVGNWNSDSEGCVLLGSYIRAAAILESAKAFTKFMDLQESIDEFTLTVS